MKHILRKEIDDRLAVLSPLEQKIAREVYGIGNGPAKPLSAVALKLGRKENELEDKLTEVLRKLREPLPVQTPHVEQVEEPMALIERIVQCADAIVVQTTHYMPKNTPARFA